MTLAAWKRLASIATRPSESSIASGSCDNVSAYDAAYVALAEALQCNLVTADRRLATATAPRCIIEVVPP